METKMQHSQFICRFGFYICVAALIGLTSGCYSTGAAQQQQVFQPQMMNGNLSGYAQPPAGYNQQQTADGHSGYQQQYAGYQPNNAGYQQQNNQGFQQQNFAAGYNQLQAQQANWNTQRGLNPFGFGKSTC